MMLQQSKMPIAYTQSSDFYDDDSWPGQLLTIIGILVNSSQSSDLPDPLLLCNGGSAVLSCLGFLLAGKCFLLAGKCGHGRSHDRRIVRRHDRSIQRSFVYDRIGGRGKVRVRVRARVRVKVRVWFRVRQGEA